MNYLFVKTRKVLLASGLLINLSICSTALAASPLDGTWYNSYCSQVEFDVDNGGSVHGKYTSHTGATGSYSMVGWINENTGDVGAGTGYPVALSIQWRPLNVDSTQADGSWHWVSNFSGQYHPAQTVSVPGQQDYQIPETLEILNVLIATSTVAGLAPKAPTTWPQTLDFHKTAPVYCEQFTPPARVTYVSKATDHISGNWKTVAGDRLVLTVDIQSAFVTGSFYDADTGITQGVHGLMDNFSEVQPNVTVAEQGLSLVIAGASESMAGGVSLTNLNQMSLLRNTLTATSWTDRFTQSAIDNLTFTRQ